MSSDKFEEAMSAVESIVDATPRRTSVSRIVCIQELMNDLDKDVADLMDRERKLKWTIANKSGFNHVERAKLGIIQHQLQQHVTTMMMLQAQKNKFYVAK